MSSEDDEPMNETSKKPAARSVQKSVIVSSKPKNKPAAVVEQETEVDVENHFETSEPPRKVIKGSVNHSKAILQEMKTGSMGNVVVLEREEVERQKKLDEEAAAAKAMESLDHSMNFEGHDVLESTAELEVGITRLEIYERGRSIEFVGECPTYALRNFSTRK